MNIYHHVNDCRWKSGVAASLAYVSLDNETSPVFHPYPSWEANTLPVNRSTDANSEEENSRIISTFRLRVDECDRLWVMDTGLADILGSPHQYKPPSIVIFDLTTDKLIRRFVIPEAQVKDDTFFANVVSSICTLSSDSRLLNVLFFLIP